MFSADLGGYTAPLPAATDPPFQKVALLLHGDGTNGAQNNTFVDYSYPGGYAVSFDGTGDWLAITANENLNITGGAFTIECWVNVPAFYIGQSMIVSQDDGLSGAQTFQFKIGSGGELKFVYWATGSRGSAVDWGTSTGVITTNTWTHVAAVYTGSTQYLFVNGVIQGTRSVPSMYSNNRNTGIGATNQGTFANFTGYISNLRIVKGTAVYTSNFTPSNLPLTAVSGTSLLTCQSATIVDNSPNAFTITANGDAAAVASKTITRTGNVAQGTFSPFSLPEGQWSNYFDGNGDYLSLAASSSLNAVSGTDFTVECWFYSEAAVNSSTYQLIVCQNSSVYQNWAIRQEGTNLQAIVGNATTSSTMLANQWVHVALVQQSNTLYLYVNGLLKQSTAITTWNNWSLDTTIGSGLGWRGFKGSISNVRIVKGTALYTSNFTPPTSPLTAITNTSLLTCQSNRFKDNSSNNFTINRNGDTKVTAFSPFAPSAAYNASTNGGSGYFDGSGDYLSAGTNTAFDFGSGDFTIEGWVYAASGVTSKYLFGVGTVDGSTRSASVWIGGSGTVEGYYSTTGNTWQSYVIGTTAIVAGSWNHIAFIKSGTSLSLYLNGVANGSQTGSATGSASSGKTVLVGGQSSAYQLNGYISNVRLVKGTALYTSNFTPPTAPLTAITNTQLLLNCTNAGIIDNSGKNDIETVGNAQISTSVKKYGTGSLAFDGTGDVLQLPVTPLLAFGSEDFTIEAWIYPTDSGTNARFYSQRNSVSVQFFLRRENSNAFRFYIVGSASVDITSSSNSVPANTWTHVAVTRAGSTFRIFVNGVLANTATSSAAITSYTLPVYISTFDGTSEPFNGYIDDLRITKGQAMYTSNFTPPTQAFPNS